MKLDPFEKSYRVHIYETGPNGKLNLFSLFDYFQDIASEHAVKLGFGKDDLRKENYFWVLSRIYTTISELPVWNDTIIVKTWPNGTDKLFALRNFEVCYQDGRHIASGTSSWLILDRTTRKIQRAESVLKHFSTKLYKDISNIRNATKLEQLKGIKEYSESYRTKISDLDENLHVNNTRYIKWVIDRYELEFVMKNVPKSVEINYLAEALHQENIVIRSSTIDEDTNYFYHSVIRTVDDKELCRMRIEWR